MCGIFGILAGGESGFPKDRFRNAVNRLFILSQSRGTEASGVIIRTGQSIYVFKEPVAATKLIKSAKYKRIFSDALNQNGAKQSGHPNPFVVFGHSRLVTSGESELNSNNQPVITNGAVGVHNGVIANADDLWEAFPELNKKLNVDTEVLFSLLQTYRKKGVPFVDAIRNTYNDITGSASVAMLFDDTNLALLATNTGSLYSCTSRNGKVIVFASEKYIVQQLITLNHLESLFDINAITHIKAGRGYIVDLLEMDCYPFALNGGTPNEIQLPSDTIAQIPVNELSSFDIPNIQVDRTRYSLTRTTRQSMINTWERLYQQDNHIRRCSKCLLTETVPYITFDEDGVCNYCHNYDARGNTPRIKGTEALKEYVSQFRSSSGEPDCIVGFSGGRDSSYGLDYVKNVLQMHPIAFTYDWAMVNDLARRNQARVVSKLGVEQIIVSADIKRKRENIRKNLEAWLKRPNLGMIPLLMAGDKQFYYYFHKVRQQTNIKLFIFSGGHEIEETPFKYGFAGVPHGVDNVMNQLTNISLLNKTRLLSFYGRNYLVNPGYINRSIFDTLFAFYCTYMLHDDYLYLFHYLEWDEEDIVSTIRQKFDWESEPDTIATWRIDDGTAPFYNYIYLTMAGFTEFDNFRSFQIREGKMSRDEAYALMVEENKPRFTAIQWYAEAVGFDSDRAIDVINHAPKLYEM